MKPDSSSHVRLPLCLASDNINHGSLEDEVRRFLQETFGSDVRQLVDRIQQDLLKELVVIIGSLGRKHAVVHEQDSGYRDPEANEFGPTHPAVGAMTANLAGEAEAMQRGFSCQAPALSRSFGAAPTPLPCCSDGKSPQPPEGSPEQLNCNPTDSYELRPCNSNHSAWKVASPPTAEDIIASPHTASTTSDNWLLTSHGDCVDGRQSDDEQTAHEICVAGDQPPGAFRKPCIGTEVTLPSAVEDAENAFDTTSTLSSMYAAPVKSKRSDSSQKVRSTPSMIDFLRAANGTMNSVGGALKFRTSEGSNSSADERRYKQFRMLRTSAAKSRSERPEFKRSMTIETQLGRATTTRLVSHEYYDYVVGLLLFLNAMVTALQVNHQSSHRDEKQPPASYQAFEAAFCVLFTLEISLRIFAYRLKFFWRNGWQWNVFDLVVVFLQCIDFFVSLVSSGDFLDSFGVLRMIRLGRVVRLLRMVRLVPALKSMVYLVAASMSSFFWTVFLLLMLMFGVAVYFTELVSDHIRSNEENEEGLTLYWGSIQQSILSLYQAITGGKDWADLTDPLVKASGLSVVLFSLYIAFATLVMLNLVTGVFVEGAQRIIKEDRDNELIRVLKKQFTKADIDGDVQISWEEFEAQLETKAMQEYFSQIDISRAEAHHLFHLIDEDSSGALSIGEFVRGCIRLRGHARSVDLATMMKDFQANFNLFAEHAEKVEKQLTWVTSRMGAAAGNGNLAAADDKIWPCSLK